MATQKAKGSCTPMYDRSCGECGEHLIDCWEPIDPPTVMCKCGGITTRVWLTKPSAVIGDEMDVWIRHGLCHEDGSARHFTSRTEWQRAMKEKGLVNRVEHLGSQGSDRSKHTTKWY